MESGVYHFSPADLKNTCTRQTTWQNQTKTPLPWRLQALMRDLHQKDREASLPDR